MARTAIAKERAKLIKRRRFYAGAALTGLLAGRTPGPLDETSWQETMVSTAFDIADLMMETEQDIDSAN